MGDTPQEKVAVYSTKLYAGTVKDIKTLAKAGKVLIDNGYSERRLIETAISLYIETHPEHVAAAKKLSEAEAAIKESN